MFGLSDLIGSPQNEIPLVTTKKNRIGNAQGAIVAEGRVTAFRDLCARRPNWRFRRDSFGLYNCAGLVWASRRTGISKNDDWLRILADDGYHQISEPELDDLVLYMDNDDRTYLHVARIIGFEKGISESSPKIPIVLSKWGHDLGECVHFDHDHALPNDYNVTIEYWTERPKDEQPFSQPTRIALR
jgi:hypothetical protein